MLKKINNQPKQGNIAKIKYFLPSSTQNRYQTPQYEENRLNKLKRSITSKYKQSYSTSKPSSKRQSISKIQHMGESLSSQINLNDASFQIIGIRDARQKSNQIIKENEHKKYKYPLSETNSNIECKLQSKTKNNDFGLTFGSSIEKHNILQSSKVIHNISKRANLQKLPNNFPKPEQKQQFQRFLQTLKKDQNYQNTITMFTIMYFYEQKAKKK